MKSFTQQYSLSEDLSGTMYQQLLDYATGICSEALLVVRHSPCPPLNAHGYEVLEQLKPFLLSMIESSQWPGTELYNHTASVYTYRFDSASSNVFKEAATSLFSWLQPDLPEDLSLLKAGGEPFLVAISHENDGYLNLTGEQKRHLQNTLPWIVPLLTRDSP